MSRIAPLAGPQGLFNVSVMPRFLLDSQQVGWQGAFFTDIDGAHEGAVCHGHARISIQRGMHHEQRRALGHRQWRPFSAGLSVWGEGDEQRYDWREGGRAQFLFLAPEVVASVLGDARALKPLGQLAPLRARVPELLFDALQADLAQGSPAGPLVGESLIVALLAHLGGMPPTPTRQPVARACARAIELIRVRFAEPLSLQDLAEASGLGQRQLSRALREATGMSPHQYLLSCRVEEARRLMNTDLSLAEIALQCGFADQSQLTRTFARQLGVTPGRYRQTLRA